MSTVGRPAKPASLHLLHGDPSKKGRGKLAALLDEELRPPVDIPELPHFLRYAGGGPAIAIEARAEWERITPHLARLGLVSQIDRAALVMYCFWWAVGVAAKQKIIDAGADGLVDTTPSGYKQMSASIQVAAKADAECRTLLAQFGLTPAARSRVTTGDPQLGLPGVDAKPEDGGWGTYS